MRRSTGHAWCGDLGRVAVGCGVFAAMISAVGVRAAENVASNIDLMEQLTASVLGELHGKFSSSVNGRAVQLRPAGSTEDYTFVTNVFREELMRLGITTVDPSSAAAPPAGGAPPDTTTSPQAGTTVASPVGNGSTPLVLQYQNVIFNLRYVDSHRSFLIGGKRVERNASVRIMTTLLDPADGGRVVWVGEAARDHNDEVDYGDAVRVEQGTYKFGQPVVPSAGWGRYAEPVFVTGIIVGLIYLFFSNQSDN